MKVEQLVGKMAIRTQVIHSGGGNLLWGDSVNASYGTEPILIEAVENGVAFYRDKPDAAPLVLSPLYRDDAWAEIPARYLPKEWAEFIPSGAK